MMNVTNFTRYPLLRTLTLIMLGVVLGLAVLSAIIQWSVKKRLENWVGGMT